MKQRREAIDRWWRRRHQRRQMAGADTSVETFLAQRQQQCDRVLAGGVPSLVAAP